MRLTASPPRPDLVAQAAPLHPLPPLPRLRPLLLAYLMPP